jgi:hypothetical protein
VALFIFHGASRDSQAGVVPKLSPAVAFLTKLLRRKLGQGKGKHPAAVAPADVDDGNFTSLAAPAFSGEVTEAAHVGSDSGDDAGGGFAEPTAGNPAAVAPSQQPQQQHHPDAVTEIGGQPWHEAAVVAEAVLVCSDSDDDDTTTGGAWAVHPAPQRASRATGQLKL